MAVVVATPFATSSAGVANADGCGGFGPGILGSDNCGASDNNMGGGDSSSDYTTWPPGMDWGSDDGGDNTSPIVPVSAP